MGALTMGLAQPQDIHSWCVGDSPMVLSEIFAEQTSVAIWQREADADISCYFASVFSELGFGAKGVFSIDSLQEAVAELLPDAEGKDKAVEDIYLLSDMLTCLFDCDSVGLRLAPLSSAMCPKFHADNIPVRLVHTYLGPGTEWLPLESVSKVAPQNPSATMAKTTAGLHYDKTHIQQMSAFNVGLLKGKAWDNHEHLACVHRSCQVEAGQQRVLLTLDPM